MTIDIFLKTITLILHVIRFGYWVVTEKKAHTQKPKLSDARMKGTAKRGIGLLFGLLLTLQLLDLPIFPFTTTIPIQLIGFTFVVIGTYISMIARREIGTNWAHAAEYQIKKHHSLVTTGIYHYIRHPIYTGMFLSVIGAEIVAESLLWIILTILILPLMYIQAKNEETILLKHFGEDYKIYQKKSKMFIP